jgi:prepilin-type N-terminal cleavage/methylation domain-containing protein
VRTKDKNKGFTIIELMIAATVFSVVLLILTYGILSIGRMYYKNITSSRTQETARAVMDDLSNSIQFSGSDILIVPGNPMTVCSGTDKYVILLNTQVRGSDHALWRDKTQEGVCGASGFDSNTSKELLSENMQLVDFNIDEQAGGLVDIRLSVAYGDEELLNRGTSPVSCLPGQGSTFCAVATLDTTAKRRIN